MAFSMSAIALLMITQRLVSATMATNSQRGGEKTHVETTGRNAGVHRRILAIDSSSLGCSRKATTVPHQDVEEGAVQEVSNGKQIAF